MSVATRMKSLGRFLALATMTVLVLDVGRADAGVTVNKIGDTLYVNGTRADDAVIIIGVDGHPGVVTVKADGQPMTGHFGFQHLIVDLAGGNNVIAMVQVHLAGNVTLNAGSGINEFIIGFEWYMLNLIWGDLIVNCPGVSEVLLEQSWVVGDAAFLLGDDGNQVTIGRTASLSDLGAVVFGDLAIQGGALDDRVEMVKSWIGGNTQIDTFAGEDQVILGTHYETGSEIAGNNFKGNVDITTGTGIDGVGLTDSTFGGDVDIHTGDDNDEVYLGDSPAFPSNAFFEDVVAHGGNGMDLLVDDPGNSYANPPSFHSFELP